MFNWNTILDSLTKQLHKSTHVTLCLQAQSSGLTGKHKLQSHYKLIDDIMELHVNWCQRWCVFHNQSACCTLCHISLFFRLSLSLSQFQSILLESGSVSQLQLATSIQCYFHAVFSIVEKPLGQKRTSLHWVIEGVVVRGAEVTAQTLSPPLRVFSCSSFRDGSSTSEPLFLSYQCTVCQVVI